MTVNSIQFKYNTQNAVQHHGRSSGNWPLDLPLDG